jgi:hypothetical protein
LVDATDAPERTDILGARYTDLRGSRERHRTEQRVNGTQCSACRPETVVEVAADLYDLSRDGLDALGEYRLTPLGVFVVHLGRHVHRQLASATVARCASGGLGTGLSFVERAALAARVRYSLLFTHVRLLPLRGGVCESGVRVRTC